MKYRIEKIICSYLNISRSESKKVLKSNRIKVNNVIINKSCSINIDVDTIQIDGENIKYKENQYFMFNKPAGYITANYDLKNSTIFDLINLNPNIFFAVGRLDKDTEGLLIVSNDGEITHKISNPKFEIPKKYYFELDKPIEANIKNHIPKPIPISNGFIVKKYDFELFSNYGFLTIYEGKFHQVKEMLNFFGYKITYLKRIKIGNLELDSNLKIGEIKELFDNDIKKIFNIKRST